PNDVFAMTTRRHADDLRPNDVPMQRRILAIADCEDPALLPAERDRKRASSRHQIRSAGIGVAIIAVAVLLVYQFVEGHFIQTIVYSRSISLSPLLVIVASLAGAELGGIIGVLLAIPVSPAFHAISVELSAGLKNETR